MMVRMGTMAGTMAGGSSDSWDPILPANLGPIDPNVKAQLVTEATTLPDSEAQDILDISDATPLGHRTMVMRYGIGAGVGLVLGFVIAKILRK